MMSLESARSIALHLQSGQAESSPNHDRPSSEMIDDKPREDRADKAHGNGTDVEGERVARADAGLLKEVDKLTSKPESRYQRSNTPPRLTQRDSAQPTRHKRSLSFEDRYP
jgi:hypothetical protein